MAVKLREHELETILKENPKKLVCVLFTTTDAPDFEKTKTWWDSLVPKYPTCMIIFADCNNCQSDARQNEIKQIPTFMFFKNRMELNKIIGRRDQQIIECIETNKPPGAFDGSSRTLGAAPDNSDFYLNLQRKKEQKIAQQSSKPSDPKQSNQQAKKETFESNLIPKKKPSSTSSTTNQQPKTFSGPSNSLSSNANNPSQEMTKQQRMALTRKELLELEFPLSVIDQAIQATNFGGVDECLEYITTHQLEEQNDNTKPVSDSKPPPEQPPIKPVVQPNSGPKKALSPSEQAMKEQLLSFGFLEDDINRALSCVGSDSIDKLIDYITRIQNGEDPQQIATKQRHEMQQRKELSKEDLEKRAQALKEKAQQREIEQMKKAPKLTAQKEFERRKEIAELAELKEKHAERQRQLDLEHAQKQKILDIQERERVLAKLAAQRGKKTEANTKEAAAPKPAATRKAPTDCTLKIQIPGNQPLVIKVPLDATFQQVDDKVRQQQPSIGLQTTVYSSSFPALTITSKDSGKTVTELKLAPRSMLTLSLQ